MPASLFARRIREAVGLSLSDHDALRSLHVVERTLRNREQLHREGEIATHCTILIDGFLARYRIVGEREQILSFHVPGDFPDLQSLQLATLDYNTVSIGPARIGLVSHTELQGVLDASASLARVFWRETLIEAAVFRDWVCNIGARDALSRIANLVCELATRLDAVGLVKMNSFHLPLIQQDIGYATGLSTVHVNRTLQELRSRKLISWDAQTVTLLDWDGLRRIAHFKPDYLHLRAEPRSNRH
jgi:CRP-like cAMP-binding protein